jgi:3-hydroxyacyl-CoA dehydrogenase
MPSTPWTKPDTITRPIAVIGAGVMGRRISMMWISAGFKITNPMREIFGERQCGRINHGKPKRASLQARHRNRRVESHRFHEEAVGNAWILIEAVPEKLQMKIGVLAEIDQIAPPDCVITSDSSSLPTSQVIVTTKNNYRICNGHYYMPPEQIYYEAISCGEMDPDIFPYLMGKAKIAGFKPVHAKVESTSLGFNRI